MTFKHVKFQDSAVMRSLEKVAREKGLVKEEALNKTASVAKKADLSPSDNLLVNLLKLSEGLREAGLDKYADELETKALAYKQAQTLYETSKEEGEDLVDAAHPKGSHKIEDVDGDELAVVETIVDQQLKSMKVVEKEPTGKLESSAAIIDSVRTVLGGDFLAVKGAAKVSLAQDAPAAPAKPSDEGGGVGTTVAGLLASIIGTQGLKWIYGKLASGGGADKELLKQLSADMGRKLTKKEAQEWSAKLVKELGEKRVSQMVAEKTAQKGAEVAGEQVVKQVAEKTVQQAGTQAAKSSGIWSRLLGLVGRSGATAAAGGEAAAVAGGEAAAGGAAAAAGGAAAVGTATVAVAVIAAAIVGGLVGNALFEHYLAPEEIKDAGDKLIAKAKELKGELSTQGVAATMEFEATFNKMLAAYPAIKELQATKSPESLVKLKQLDELLWQSHKQALSIWGWAQSAADDQFLPRWMSKMGELIALAKNYMDRCNEITSLMGKFISDANKIADEKLKQQQTQQVSAGGGPEVVNLKNAYTKAKADLDRYTQVIKAKELPNGQALLAWLDKAQKALAAETAKFNAVPEPSKPDVAKIYTDRLNTKLLPKLKGFADKWMA